MHTEAIESKIKQQWERNSVLLYMKGMPEMPACGFSAQVVSVLKSLQTEFAYVNILEDLELRSALKTISDWPTYPQLYIHGEFIGGCDIVMELYESVELFELLKKANAIKDNTSFIEVD